MLCSELGLSEAEVAGLRQSNTDLPAEEDLIRIYEIVVKFLKERSHTSSTGHTGNLEKLSLAAFASRFGGFSALPENLKIPILDVYQKFIEAYLNILRQKENKPRDWFPKSLFIDPELANGMRHFFSDYQHITKQYFELNQKLDQLMAIDRDTQPNLYLENAKEVMRLCAE